MKIYGTVDFRNNPLNNLVLTADTDFPTSSPDGKLVFKNNVLYISVMVDGQLAWIPLTNELQTLVFTTAIPLTTWVIDHNYNTVDLVIQLYDSDNMLIEADSVVKTTANRVTVEFLGATAGSALIISRRTQ